MGARPPRAQFAAPSRKTRAHRRVSSVQVSVTRNRRRRGRHRLRPRRACSPNCGIRIQDFPGLRRGRPPAAVLTRTPKWKWERARPGRSLPRPRGKPGRTGEFQASKSASRATAGGEGATGYARGGRAPQLRNSDSRTGAGVSPNGDAPEPFRNYSPSQADPDQQQP